MSRESSITARKTGMAFLLAVGMCLLSVGDAPAGKKTHKSGKTTPTPSPVGEANGVAHRVAALEEGLAETQEALAETQAALEETREALGETQDVLLSVMERVMDLEDAVVALDARIAALEEAAAAPVVEPVP